MKRIAPLLLAFGLATIAACGSDQAATSEAAELSDTGASDTGASDTSVSDTGASEADEAAGIRLVSATDGAAIVDDPPEGLVILDVRTPEEFSEARIDGATMLDFYREDFAEQLAELDRDTPYLLYCRSGNRSGQTSALMKTLGFSNVAEVDGGILSWNGAALPVVSG